MQRDLKICRSCGIELNQRNERTCGICTECLRSELYTPIKIPLPHYSITEEMETQDDHGI